METKASGKVVAVVGATGAVGREMLSVLEARKYPVSEIRPLASARSAGSTVECFGDEFEVEELTEESFAGVDIALFSAGGSISEKYGPIAVGAGATVIDNSSAFRMTEGIPLVVPEVNGDAVREAIANRSGKGLLIANPNCSTIQLVVALKPFADNFGLKRVVVSTYQSVSGAGQKGLDELWNQCLAIFNQQEVVTKQFPHQIAFNCIPHIDVFLDNGYTKEEMKVVNESKKILSLPELKITATAVRVPVFSCHSESVNVETEKPAELDEVRKILAESPGIVLDDNPETNRYPLGLSAAGSDATLIGRLRRDESVENGFNMWVVADNLRKGAALNAVQIAEIVIEQ